MRDRSDRPCFQFMVSVVRKDYTEAVEYTSVGLKNSETGKDVDFSADAGEYKQQVFDAMFGELPHDLKSKIFWTTAQDSEQAKRWEWCVLP